MRSASDSIEFTAHERAVEKARGYLREVRRRHAHIASICGPGCSLHAQELLRQSAEELAQAAEALHALGAAE